MNITEVLIEYREKQNKDVLGFNEIETDNEDLNIIVIEILSWLKLEHKREIWISEAKKTKLKGLNLNKDYSWCKLLMLLVESETILADYFEIQDNEMNFRSDIDLKLRQEARASAYELYNPEKIM